VGGSGTEEDIVTYAAMLIDDDDMHAEALTARLRARGLNVDRYSNADRAFSALMHNRAHYDLTLINVSDSSRPWLRIVRKLQDACFSFGHHHTMILCLSTVRREPQLELQIERLGARLVYER
jgi:DNA-binding response OmpR family regulator